MGGCPQNVRSRCAERDRPSDARRARRSASRPAAVAFPATGYEARSWRSNRRLVLPPGTGPFRHHVRGRIVPDRAPAPSGTAYEAGSCRTGHRAVPAPRTSRDRGWPLTGCQPRRGFVDGGSRGSRHLIPRSSGRRHLVGGPGDLLGIRSWFVTGAAGDRRARRAIDGRAAGGDGRAAAQPRAGMPGAGQVVEGRGAASNSIVASNGGSSSTYPPGTPSPRSMSAQRRPVQVAVPLTRFASAWSSVTRHRPL